MADINAAKRIVLEQYLQERKELDMMISRLRRDLQLSDESDVSPDAGNGGELKAPSTNVLLLIKPGDLFGATQIEAVKKVLSLTARQPLSLQEIAAALHRGKATESLIEGIALRNLSSVMSRSDDLISVAKGRWGLAEWYPNKAKRKKSKDLPDGERTDGEPGVSEGV